MNSNIHIFFCEFITRSSNKFGEIQFQFIIHSIPILFLLENCLSLINNHFFLYSIHSSILLFISYDCSLYIHHFHEFKCISKRTIFIRIHYWTNYLSLKLSEITLDLLLIFTIFIKLFIIIPNIYMRTVMNEMNIKMFTIHTIHSFFSPIIFNSVKLSFLKCQCCFLNILSLSLHSSFIHSSINLRCMNIH